MAVGCGGQLQPNSSPGLAKGGLCAAWAAAAVSLSATVEKQESQLDSVEKMGYGIFCES